MFAEERIQDILDTLKKDGKVKVKDLSTKYSVTEDCIRKDLKALEKIVPIKRIYGGAVLHRESLAYHSTKQRLGENIDIKRKIAEKAFDMVNNMETIFLDVSTVNLILAELLAKSGKKLTIVTNMVDILNLFTNIDHNIQVVSAGGILNSTINGFVGASTIDFLSNYKFDKSFIGTGGIDVPSNCLTIFEIDDGLTKKSVMENSREIYVVAESKKFAFDCAYQFYSLDNIDAIITDEKPDSDTIKLLDEYNITIV
ncbi:DeoR/GlpR transcriptional regulator [Peptacetobacter hominis]|uniref:DeoR/GlpR transcriptional regulator n=1 Tax=Peptacetobacter hominis TaxID=2743610 RepID=A0A544QVL0_9FIRM|nr:DeoR/GlpR family DNA-binding transcription regulator [Peptacetobacter hominis]TQQ84729.1 DeoR/GlpR transcriptional regulator [Peptacetobacter hominis]